MINMIVLSCLVILSLIIASPITVDAQPYLDPNAAIETRVEDLLGRLNLQEKVGQMIMDIENAGEKAPGIGSYMIGASDPPLLGNTPAGWRQRRNQLQAANVANQRYGIPLLMAADAVHGHNILQNATIFPHNIGLGCTRNPALVRQVAHVTASEVASTAVDLTFAPTLAVARDMRWGRTYESFSQDTDLVRLYAQDVIQGLQQGGGGGMPYKIVATAKHWIGDGGTTNGDDAGDTAVSSEAELLQIHGLPYNDAIAADVGAIMISFSSVNGLQMHQHERLITQVLKDDKSFQGLVMSDWLGHQRIPGDLFTQIRSAVNAGIDMLMVPYQAYAVMNAIFVQVNSGSIPQSRIDDAVRRILRVKFKAGLFETMVNPIDPNTFAPIRTVAHQDTARQAVRESLVMLRNDNDILPLDKTTTRIFLAGKSADNIQNQCGGWTMSWQGNSNLDRHRIVGGTTVKQGLEMHSNLAVTHNPIGIGAAGHDVAIVVVGETPYAEGAGDDLDLQLDAQDKAAIANAKSAGIPVVLMLISGRPMILDDDILNGLDAIVAAWLPGTEGDGIAQVLFGDYDFTGKLSFSWPRNIGQLQAGFIGHNANVLFPLGYGLSYGIQPTKSPTRAPTRMPTKTPTRVPTQDPATTSHPTSAPTNNPTASPTKSPAPTASPEISTTCSAHPDCTGLAGECCPTIDGLRLACCRPQPPSQVPPSPAPPSPAPPSPAPPSPAPLTPGSSDACAAHPRCVGLAGTCCPVASTGVRLECCNHDQALPPPEYPNQTGLCSAHPRCAALSGDCCPTITGVMLACCDEEQSLAVYQAIVAQQDKSSGGKQAASSPRYWWFLSTLVVAIFLSLIF